MGAASSVALASHRSGGREGPKMTPTVANSLGKTENSTSILLGRLTEIRLLKLSHEGIVIILRKEFP